MSQPPPTALLALLLALGPAAFWYGLVEPFESLKSALTQLVALALVVAAGWRWADVRRLFAGPVGLALAAGVAVAAVSTAFSVCPRTSLLGDTDSHDGLGHVAALAVVFAASRAAGPRGGLVAAVAVGLSIACAYALVQVAGLDPLRWDQASGFHAWRRPGGTLGHPNYLAGYAVMALPLLAWLAATSGWRGRLGCGLLAAAALLVVVATLSRGAWLAGLAAAGVMFALWPGRRKLLWAGGLAAGALLLALAACLVLGDSFADSLRERLGGLAYSPARRPVWQAAWRVFLDHPWLGSGPDTFGPAFTRARTPEYWQVEWGLLPRRAHNDLLHALATQGIAGGLAYVGLALALALTCVRAWRRRPGRRPLVAALAGAAVAFYVQNVFGFAVAGTAALFAFVAGVIASLEDERAADPRAAHEVSEFAFTHPLTSCAARLVVTVPLAWLVVAPVVASAVSRRADLDPSWHAVAVRLAPWHDLFHSRRCIAALDDAEAAPTADRKRARLIEARAAAAEACRLSPRWAHHHANLGRALLELARAGAADPAEAMAAFDRALGLDPCDPLAFADAARAATALGRPAEAERYVARGLAVDPDLGPLHAELGTARLARATRSAPCDPALLAEAEATLRSALTRQWHGEVERLDRARLMLALALVQRGECAEALAHVEGVRGRRPEWPAAGWLTGVALERGGRRGDALSAYRDVLRRWPDNPQAAAGVARLTR
jgi:putative inorganic carbon (HCO3(-)) transporter